MYTIVKICVVHEALFFVQPFCCNCDIPVPNSICTVKRGEIDVRGEIDG